MAEPAQRLDAGDASREQRSRVTEREAPDEDFEEVLRYLKDARGFDFTGCKRSLRSNAGEPNGAILVVEQSG